MDEGVNQDKGYIHDDIKGRPFFWFSIGFAVFTILSFVGVYWLYGELSGYHDRNQADVPTRVTTVEAAPPGPRLQNDPVADMNAMRAEQTAVLESYGWVDEEKGIVRIPIESAMKLTLEQSLVRAQTPNATPAAAEAAN